MIDERSNALMLGISTLADQMPSPDPAEMFDEVTVEIGGHLADRSLTKLLTRASAARIVRGAAQRRGGE
jgi:hypothetical protein